jgi:hypothetical protein
LGGIADFFSSLSIIYFIGAGVTVYGLARGWRDFWDDKLTPRDYQLAGGAAFFLLVPIGVLLHEFGHMLAAWSTGAEVLSLGYFLYWGYVSYIPATGDPLAEWYVSLAGNAFSYFLGIACLIAAVRFVRLPVILRVVLLQLGILEIAQTLIFYPLLDLDPNFNGDWESIYFFRAPIASGITAAIHVVSLAAFVFFINRNSTARRLLRFN